MTDNPPDTPDDGKPKYSPISEMQRIDVVKIVKTGLLYSKMLNEFENNFVVDIATRYAAYGKKLQMSPKQLNILYNVADKLDVPVNT